MIYGGHMGKIITISLPEGFDNKPTEEKDAVLEKDLDKFSDFLKTLNNKWMNNPLTPQERALIKSYLIWKIAKEV